ncbi:flagellar type III secretion system pore protein FliP [Buchnera aphidicola]|uniref:flagellar type III secretion system pore protein FliP n=1 Tax=Buchnera aphidicola TaxID=9 RepID=UPI0025AF5D8B|nr:flagellar type III secretion system pore protein FliP [Buchnera aphidicola]
MFFLTFFSINAEAKNIFNFDDLFHKNINSLEFSSAFQIFIFLSFLTFIPIIILMMTCFTRIIIVFGLLRNAMGTPYVPPNQILLGLSLFLTFFIMEPYLNKIYNNAYVPFDENKINFKTAINKTLNPLKEFMFNQTKRKDLLVFSKLAHLNFSYKKEDISFRVLIPAFMTSELKTAFKIGFSIFIPFLIIDLLVSSILMSLGMMMVPPSTVSLPLKLIIFVLSDGWKLLITSLSRSFH